MKGRYTKCLQIAYCVVLSLLLVGVFMGCKSVKEFKTLTQCEYKFDNLSHFNVAGVDFNGIQSIKDISLADVTALTSALLSKTLPISFNVNLQVSNPNPSMASVSGLEWILVLDKKELISGHTEQPISVAANSSEKVALRATVKAEDLLNKQSLQSLMQLYLKLSGKDTDSELVVKLKPTISVGKKTLRSPSYISIKPDLKPLKK